MTRPRTEARRGGRQGPPASARARLLVPMLASLGLAACGPAAVVGGGVAGGLVLSEDDDGHDAPPSESTSGTSFSREFQDTGQTLGDARTEALVAGDVDGDGDADLVAGNSRAGNQVYVNDGQASFLSKGRPLGGQDTRALALGDLDGDGDPDLVEGTVSPDRVWRNDGRGTFSDTGQRLSVAPADSDRTIAVQIGGVNADDHLDVLTMSGDSLHVWLNDGTGTLNLAGTFELSFLPAHMVAGDVDGDGDLDAVFGQTATAFDVHVWLNDGTGGYAPGDRAAPGDHVDDLALGDMDGDADLDVVLIRPNRVLRNRGDGTFDDPHASSPSPLPVRAGGLGDIDLDGDLDLAIEGENLRVNRGDGQLVTSDVPIDSSGTALRLEDLDGDGFPDLAIGRFDKPNLVLLNRR